MSQNKMSIPEKACYGHVIQEAWERTISNFDKNDGSTAKHYELPAGATELKHLIWFKNMNAQVGEAFRSLYRLNDCPHSDTKRNLRKVIAYCEQELERLEKYGSN